MATTRILIAGDDPSLLASLAPVLEDEGHVPVVASSPQDAIARLSEGGISLVLQDLGAVSGASGGQGPELLARMLRSRPHLPVLAITAWESTELGVAAVKAGAADFITAPWSRAQLVQAVRTALDLAACRRGGPPPAQLARRELDAHYDFNGIVGESRRLLEVLDLIGRVSATDASVLVTGESGTGKGTITRAIHRNNPRRKRKLVRVDLAGLPYTRFSSEMLGYSRRAFADARRHHRGRLSVAAGGTLHLDHVGEVDMRSQVTLLRVLQDRAYQPLESPTSKELDVRVVSTSDRDLAQAVANGSFREDLLCRLALVSVHLPRLADRREDIPLLASHFLRSARSSCGRAAQALSSSAMAWLQEQEWPGNVRQLEILVERAALVAGVSTLRPEDLVRTSAMDHGPDVFPRRRSPEDMARDAVDRALIERTLQLHGGNLSQAAAALGLSRASLHRRIAKHGIEI